MTSTLTLISVNKLQQEINKTLKSFNGNTGIYISLNKTQKKIEEILKKEKINIKKLFFIDCVTSNKTKDDVLHISPDRLDLLNSAINSFIKDIKGQKFLILDALSSLLIFNNENKVADFIKEITQEASQNHTNVIAFSPQTKGKELLNQIFDYFDEVKKV